MGKRMVVRCPNCGALAHRHWRDTRPEQCACPDQLVVQVECPVCDYFLMMSWQNGKVIEAYAPGVWASLSTKTGVGLDAIALDFEADSEPAIALLPIADVITHRPQRLLAD